ncbi:hypothetical protein Adt_24181 [Abeliophyllum distichum]|uniref:Uncharacterized protein n=1 Tax=Abeliophyllum distichum TaxID=126358 RepID=A0ABD1SDS4_9LAMI
MEEQVLLFKLDALVAVEADLKAKLDSATENLRQVWSQKRHAKATKKLAEDLAAAVENTVISVNFDFNEMVPEKEKQLAEAKRELKKMKEEQAEAAVEEEAEARTVKSYKKEVPNKPEYLCLANRFMVASGKQLVDRIREVQPKWDLSFLMPAPTDPLSPKDSAAAEFLSFVEPQAEGKAHIPIPILEEGPEYTDLREAAGQ